MTNTGVKFTFALLPHTPVRSFSYKDRGEELHVAHSHRFVPFEISGSFCKYSGARSFDRGILSETRRVIDRGSISHGH